MSNGVEAASLFVRIGDVGAEETLRRMLAVGTLVDRLNGERADVLTAADTRTTIADLDKTRAAAELLEKIDPRVTTTGDSASAVKSINVAKSAADLLDASDPVITITADPNSAQKSMLSVLARAGLLDATNPSIDIKVDAARPNALIEQVKEHAVTINRVKPLISPAVRTAPAHAEVERLIAELKRLDEMEPVITPQVSMGHMGMTGGGAGNMRSMLGQAAMFMQPGFAMPMMLQNIAQGMSVAKVAAAGLAGGIALIGVKALQAQGEFERFETQFSVLLGSVGAAKVRIRELTEFAATTPFELPQVVMASKTLEMFTKGAISTGAGLRLVGDVAAGTGTDIGETAMWFGRLYDAMKSGRPFGEASMRLQEMGAISGEGRVKLEELGEAVKNGGMDMTKAWGEATLTFGRFSGMMEAQSKTTEGKLSNLSDAVGQVFLKIGNALEPLFHAGIDTLINGVAAVSSLLDGLIEHFANAIGVARDLIGVMDEQLKQMTGFLDYVSGKQAAQEAAEEAWRQSQHKTLQETILTNELIAESERFKAAEAEAAANKQKEAAWLAFREGRKWANAGEEQIRNFGMEALMEEHLAKPVRNKAREARNALVQSIADMADAVRGARGVMAAAGRSLADSTYDPLILAAEKASVQAELASKDLAKNLRSKDPEIKRDAEMRVLELRKRLMEITSDQIKYGNDASRAARAAGILQSKEYLEGVHSTDRQRQLDAKNLALVMVDEIVASLPLAELWGFKTGDAYADGLLASRKEVKWAAKAVAASARGVMIAHSPPGPESPLHDIDKWGYKTGSAWVEGLVEGILKGKGPIKRKLEEIAKIAVDFIKGIDAYIGAATPEGQEATLKRQITSLVAAIARTADPAERYKLLEELVEKQRRLEGLEGKEASPEDILIDKLRGYIGNLDRAFANEKDPKKRAAIALRIAEYMGRIEALEEKERRRLEGEEEAKSEAADKKADAESQLDRLKDAVLESGIGSDAWKDAIYDLENAIGGELPADLGERMKAAIASSGFFGPEMQAIFADLISRILGADPNAAATFQANRSQEQLEQDQLADAVAEGTANGIDMAGQSEPINYSGGQAATGGPSVVVQVNVTVEGGIVAPGVADDIANHLGPSLKKWVQQQQSDLVASSPVHTHT